MAGERIRLEVKDRESRGSAEARRLRKQGLVPGVLYGRGKTPHAFCVEQRELRRAFSGPSGLHAILDVVLDGQKTPHHAILKSYQQDPLRGGLTHIDLHEVRLDQPIQAQVSRDVRVEGLPMSIPEHLELDVSELGIGDTMRLADLTPPEGITFLDDPEEVVLANVTLPTQIVEPEEEEEELEEGVEVPEGEEAPEGAAAAPAEPGGDAAGEPGPVEG